MKALYMDAMGATLDIEEFKKRWADKAPKQELAHNELIRDRLKYLANKL